MFSFQIQMSATGPGGCRIDRQLVIVGQKPGECRVAGKERNRFCFHTHQEIPFGGLAAVHGDKKP